MSHSDSPRPITLHIGSEELVIRKRYEALSIVNDILVGLWFLVGSIMFFSPSWTTTGTWLFVAGSAELLIRPLIRLTRHIHLGKISADPLRGGRSTDQDY